MSVATYAQRIERRQESQSRRLVIAAIMAGTPCLTVPVKAGTVPDDDGLLAAEGRALHDVQLPGEPQHDVKRAEAIPELIGAAPW